MLSEHLVQPYELPGALLTRANRVLSVFSYRRIFGMRIQILGDHLTCTWCMFNVQTIIFSTFSKINLSRQTFYLVVLLGLRYVLYAFRYVWKQKPRWGKMLANNVTRKWVIFGYWKTKPKRFVYALNGLHSTEQENCFILDDSVFTSCVSLIWGTSANNQRLFSWNRKSVFKNEFSYGKHYTNKVLSTACDIAVLLYIPFDAYCFHFTGTIEHPNEHM